MHILPRLDAKRLGDDISRMRTKRIGVGIVVAMVVAVAACSAGSGSTTPGNGTGFTSQSYCEQRNARLQKCSPTFDSGVDSGVVYVNTSSCTKDYDCIVAAFSNPDAVLNCKVNPDCSQSSGDSCNEKSSSGITTDRDACLKRREECKAQGKSFSDDNCVVLPALKPAVAQKLIACTQGACDQVSDCFKAVEKELPGCD